MQDAVRVALQAAASVAVWEESFSIGERLAGNANQAALPLKPGSYLVKAEIPGVRKEDIDVRINGSLVTISAEAKTEKQVQDNGRVFCKERQEGYASRPFTLACPVDEDHADASYKDGVLSLKLPKKAATSTKRLAIQ